MCVWGVYLQYVCVYQRITAETDSVPASSAPPVGCMGPASLSDAAGLVRTCPDSMFKPHGHHTLLHCSFEQHCRRLLQKDFC